MTKQTQTQTRATSAADVRKAGKAFLATVKKDGLSALRTDEDKYAGLWAEVWQYVDEEGAVRALEMAETDHATATAALEAARANEADKRAALKVATAYRQSVEDMRRTVGLEMVALGLAGRQVARILGVTEGAVRKWRKAEAEVDAPKKGAPKKGEPEVTAPTPEEVRRALDAVAAMLDGLDPVTSVKVMTSLESRVSKVTAALAALQARSAKESRNVA